MDNILQYIDDYFTGQLKGEDRQVFERRCETDQDFAKEVGLYISMRGALRKSLDDIKKKDLNALFETNDASLKEHKISIPLYAWISGIAAAILLAVLVLFFVDNPDPQKLASTYIEENLSTISVTMGAEQDSLALGVNAYNEGDFSKAEAIFQDLVKHPSVAFNSTKYLGLVALSTGSYENALEYFDELSAAEGMYANPGLFYKAVTLMKRSGEGDVPQAKVLLQQVVRDRMAGHKEAERWLQLMD